MNDNKTRVGIIGIGPVGMILATHLKEAGCAVMICDNDKIKINLIRNEGIKLEQVIAKQAKFNAIFSSPEELLAQNPDYVFIALKTYQEESALKEIPETNTSVFISAQNGIDV